LWGIKNVQFHLDFICFATATVYTTFVPTYFCSPKISKERKFQGTKVPGSIIELASGLT